MRRVWSDIRCYCKRIVGSNTMKKKALIIVGSSSHVMHEYQPIQTYSTIFLGSRKVSNETAWRNTVNNERYFKYDLDKDDPAKLELLGDLERYDCIDVIFASYVSEGLNAQDDMMEIQKGLTGNCIQPLSFMSNLCLRFPNKTIGGVFISSIYAHVSPNSSNYIDGPQINPIFYGVAKAGVEQGLKWLSCQNEKHYFNSIALGPVPKDSIQHQYPEFIRRLESFIPSGRLIARKTLHRTIDYLLSQEGDVRGHTLFVDGGYRAW